MGSGVSEEQNGREKPRKSWWRRKPLLSFMILLLLFYLFHPPIITFVANRTLDWLFASETRVERVALYPFRGRLQVVGLRCAQPEGYGAGALLAVDEIVVDIGYAALLKGELLVEEVEIVNPRFAAVMTGEFDTNIVALFSSGFFAPAPVEEPITDDDVVLTQEEGVVFPRIEVAQLRISGAEATGLFSGPEQPWTADLASTDLVLDDFYIEGDGALRAALSRLELHLGRGRILLNGAGAKPFVSSTPASVALDSVVYADDIIDIGTADMGTLVFSLFAIDANQRALQGYIEDMSAAAPKEPPTVKDASKRAEDTPPPLAAIRLNRFTLDDFGAHIYYSDEAGTPLHLAIPDIDLQLDDYALLFGNAKIAKPKVTLNLDMEIAQGAAPSSLLHMTIVSEDFNASEVKVPAAELKLCMTGFLLETVGAFLPPGAAEAVGGDGFDVWLVTDVDHQRVRIVGEVLSDASVFYPLDIDTTWDELSVGAATVLLGVAGRLTGGIVDLGKMGFGFGSSVIGGGVDAVVDVGSGAVTITKNLFKGAGDIIAGVFTFDGESIKEGLEKGTVDNVTELKDTAEEAGSGVGEGFEEGVDQGDQALQLWLVGISTRHAQNRERLAAEDPATFKTEQRDEPDEDEGKSRRERRQRD